MSTASDPLATSLRQVADNLDRAASISAQYCASGHHTAAIREAADRLERDAAELAKAEAMRQALVEVIGMRIGRISELETELARARRERDGLRDACSWYLKPDVPIRTFAERDSIFRGKLAALAIPKGATP
jgi:hypothetical protein